MKTLFALALLASTIVFAEKTEKPSTATIIRHKACVVKTIDCSWVNNVESREVGQANSCSLNYSYLLRQKVTVIKPDGTIVELKEPEENAVFKTFTKTFTYDKLLKSNDWTKMCYEPCRKDLLSVVELYGNCP